VSYGEDNDLGVMHHVDHRIGKVLDQHSPDCERFGNPRHKPPPLRVLANRGDRCTNGSTKPTRCLRASRAIPPNGFEILGRGFLVQAE
jgi:hypothetical protein